MAPARIDVLPREACSLHRVPLDRRGCLSVSTVSGCVGFCGGRAYVRECRSLDIQHYVSLTRAVERRHFFVLNGIEARPTAACRSTHFLSAHQVRVFTARPCNPDGVNRSHRPGEAHSYLTGRGKYFCVLRVSVFRAGLHSTPLQPQWCEQKPSPRRGPQLPDREGEIFLCAPCSVCPCSVQVFTARPRAPRWCEQKPSPWRGPQLPDRREGEMFLCAPCSVCPCSKA